MKKIKLSFLLTVVLMFILVLSACGSDSNNSSEKAASENESAESYRFKLSLNVPPTHMWTESAELFKQTLEEKTDGRIIVDLFPNSQLGETKEITQMLSQGTLDFAYIPTAFLTPNYKELNAWYMPFLFEDVEEALKMAESDTAQELLNVFEQQGLIGIDWAFTNNHHILMTSGKMTTPEDFKGIKLRSPGTDAINDLYNELGASSVAMPLSEIYTSLQNGVVDGINASIESVSSSKYYEVANDYTLLNLSSFNSVILMSQKTKDKLSDEDAEIIMSAFEEAVNWLNEEIRNEAEANMAELKQQDGFTIHEIENYAPFYEARDTIYEKYSNEYPLIKTFIEEAQAQ